MELNGLALLVEYGAVGFSGNPNPLADNHFVACHLPRGSKLRWREDMGGWLPNARGPRITPNRILVLALEAISLLRTLK